MINPIKLKRLKILAEKISNYDKPLAFELEKMVNSIENGFHNGEGKIAESVVSAFQKVSLSKSIALIGGLAVSHWVKTRTTDDVDFVILSDELQSVENQLKGGRKSVFGYSVKIDGTNVDFLSSYHFSWAKESIDTAIDVEMMGKNIKIVRPEYLLLFKIESSRNIDFADIIALLTIKDVATKARELIYKFMPTNMEDFEQYVSMAENGIF